VRDEPNPRRPQSDTADSRACPQPSPRSSSGGGWRTGAHIPWGSTLMAEAAGSAPPLRTSSVPNSALRSPDRQEAAHLLDATTGIRPAHLRACRIGIRELRRGAPRGSGVAKELIEATATNAREPRIPPFLTRSSPQIPRTGGRSERGLASACRYGSLPAHRGSNGAHGGSRREWGMLLAQPPAPILASWRRC
jgi:hypothetical protein